VALAASDGGGGLYCNTVRCLGKKKTVGIGIVVEGELFVVAVAIEKGDEMDDVVGMGGGGYCLDWDVGKASFLQRDAFQEA